MAEVYGAFYNGHGSTLEHTNAAVSFRGWIEGSADKQEREERSAMAVEAITRCSLPDADRIGPVGGGCIFRYFFGMPKPPSPLSTPPHVNEALRRRPRRPTDRVSLADEPPMFTHNFLWDPPTRRIWLVDCEYINVLPSAFFSFYLHRFRLLFPLLLLHRPARTRVRFLVSAKLPFAAIVCRAATRRLASTRTESTHGAAALPVFLRSRIRGPRCQ